ncbi:peptidase M11 [Ferrimonas sediminicola]|uniref:Peptidase M11 n=1 Tax=Ferrimonas sediminicola TaxID=2569538 RepID=A0A4V5NV62_9GAMM|nr:Ig-like domain-containing protein [Ferrimonas sediminicola]TKB49274.1 peptidase M11 [Ferrimonas sediminicola]
MRSIFVSVASRRFAVPNLSVRCSLLAACLTVGLSLPFAVEVAEAAPASKTEQPHRDVIGSQTLSLSGLMARYRHAGEAEQAQLLDEMVDKARTRQALMSDLIVRDPGAALAVALPAGSHQGMPPRVQEMLEQKRVIEGELEVTYQDFDDGSHQLRQVLRTSSGERISLHLAGHSQGMTSGLKIRANGLQVGDAMAVASGDDILVLAADGGLDGGASGTAPVLSNALGEQRTAVLLVNFTSNTAEPWTAAEAHDLVFGEVSEFFQENSYGKTWLAGDVFGWYTLAVDPSGCPTMDIAQAARQAASNAGVDLSGYDRLVYAYPNIGCSWSGEATVGGSPSQAWFDGTLNSAGVVSHELGHNLGLMHSHALACAGQPPLSDSCLSVEYGDVLDRMGQHSAGHFATFQKQRLGWVGTSDTPEVLTATASGSYRIEPVSAQSGGAKAIRVPRDLDPVTGQQRWYYLETHQEIGFDQFLGSSSYGDSVINGLVVRLGTDNHGGSSYLLDMTPGSQYYDWNDLALPLGDTYTDATAGVSITLTDIGIDGATVSVSYDQASCVRGAPSVSVSPGESQWVAPGTPVSYAVTVTNNDSAACSGSGFDLTAQVPSGWSSGFAEPVLSLAPGASATASLTVESPLDAADGYYELTIDVVNGLDAAYQARATATYIVSGSTGSTNQPPVAEDDAVSISAVEAVVIAVMDNDWDPDGDALSISGIGQGAKGSVTLNGDGTLTYLPGKRFKNGDSFSYRLTDGTDTVTGQVTISLQKGTGGGGNAGGGKGNKK